jgi:hypothetical protein
VLELRDAIGGVGRTAKCVETFFAAMLCRRFATTQLRSGEGQWRDTVALLGNVEDVKLGEVRGTAMPRLDEVSERSSSSLASASAHPPHQLYPSDCRRPCLDFVLMVNVLSMKTM